MSATTTQARQLKALVYLGQSGPVGKRGELKGSKVRIRDEDRLLSTKTRYIDASELSRVQSYLSGDPEIESQMLKRTTNNLRYRSFSRSQKQPGKQRSLQELISILDPSMMVSSSIHSSPKKIRLRDLPSFASSNLEDKMNEYLNIIIRKGQQGQHEGLRHGQQAAEGKPSRTQSIFLRRMKMSQSKRREEQASWASQGSSPRFSDKQFVSSLKQNIKKHHATFYDYRK